MSALFNFHSFLTVVLLGICTCTFLKMQFPAILEQRTGWRMMGGCCNQVSVELDFPCVHQPLNVKN
ncbi:hypothetical protein ES319_D01G186400v1 [Gossypium barbadense]|uniref:Protein kish n=2 Tax=Gossypium TaxID=3633 RepID=A0A5J5SQ65_GOSBA|nr:hypothetical protein ES319_D01G186400v1 [Gossypium barbadense]TYG83842.1 hypothetical protein ES288_D01G200500v1 [Gossypium darwinii]